MIVPADAERAHENVVVGSRWFGWGHHWTLKRERVVEGVHQVLMHRVTGPRKNVDVWVDSWRVQKYCTPREDS